MKSSILLYLLFFLIPTTTPQKRKTRHRYFTIGDYINKTEPQGPQQTPSSSSSSEEDPENKPLKFSAYPESALQLAYNHFKLTFKLSFPNPSEDKMRFSLFKKNLRRILDHNANSKNYKMGINQFIVFTDAEFHSKILDPKPLKETKKENNERLLDDVEEIKEILAAFPSHLDWEKKGKVTPVKHQQNCQGCYVFSAMAALESAILIKYNKQIILSEQEIVDCSYGFKNNGCVGGQPTFVYDYINLNGINLDENYEYIGMEDRCKAPTKQMVFKHLKSYIKPEENIVAIIKLLQYGPVVVNHYVPDDFKYYSSGIFETNDCHHQIIINHSSIIVGYNFKSDPPYFKLKNSWGLKWGNAGYYKVKIGELSYSNPGFCHLASNGYNAFPVIK